ncbi:MAG: hypothetical protein ACI9D5_002337 [Candidatus Endobugula sp.]|jgi:hypothetical protein
MYSTLGCHLCELAKTQIEPLLAPFALKLKEVDIADDDILLEKYGVRIPVIRLEGSIKTMGWPFDTEGVYVWLQAQL